METSTPVGSPLRRRLTLGQNVIAIERDEDDLESELQRRRLEAINKSKEVKRRSLAAAKPVGLNAAQLAEHSKDCIKLSTENKINSKNAFNLLLIDYMAAMTKKSDSEISNNFQVASCTLDASVKIYGCRVDAVYTDAMKMAGGFLKKEMQEAVDVDEPDEKSADEGKERGKVKPKKRKKKATVVDPSLLNAKSESEALLDAVPKKSLLCRNTDGTQLLTRIPKYNDGCLLMVEADAPCWPFGPNEPLVPKFQMGETFDPELIMSIFSSIKVSKNDKLCAELSNIEFGRDDDAESELEISQTSTFEFDINASVSEVDCEEPAPRLAVPCGGYNSDDEIAMPLEKPRCVAPASVVDMKRRLSVHNMEYSMFDDKVMKAWAGPTYWKVRPSRESNSENKENEAGLHALPVKRTRRGRVKEVVDLFEVADDVLARHLAPSEKAVLARNTLCGWKPAAVTLAEDYKYQPRHLFQLFHLPLTVIEPRKDTPVLEELGEDQDDEGPSCDLGEELEYCSSQVVPEDEPPMETVANSSNVEVAAWDADNMVAVPIKVEKIAVGVLQRRKHIDIKYLKRCIWDILVGGEASKGNPLPFRELLTFSRKRLPVSLSGCVSVPMLFNAVLHLANERNLVLTLVPYKRDFTISLA